MYIYIYTCTYIYIHVHTYVYIYIGVYHFETCYPVPRPVQYPGRFRLTMRLEVVVSLLTIVTVDASQLQRMFDAASFEAMGSIKNGFKHTFESKVSSIYTQVGRI